MTLAASAPGNRAPLLAADFVAFLAACGLVTAALWQADRFSEARARAVALIFFLLIVPVEVLVHEGGHFAMARLLGWRVPLVSWGPFTLRRSPLRLTIGAPAFGSGAAGAVVAVPPSGADRNWAWALVFAGGPLANAVLAGLASAAAAAAPSETPRVLLIVTAVISALSCLYNLMARRGCDGAQLRDVLRHKNGATRGLHARLIDQSLRGIRPRDWPADMIAVVRRLALWSDDPDLMLALYAWHLDRGETGPARAALARSRPDECVAAEQAFCAAWFDRDGAVARALLGRTGSWSLHGQTCYWRARAALAIRETDGTSAREAIRKGRILVRDSPYATALDADWFDAMEKELT